MRLRLNYIIGAEAVQGEMLILLEIIYAYLVGRYRRSGKLGTENPRVIGSIPILATIFVSAPVKPTGFFRFKFSVWRIERTGECHKAAKILRFAFSGDTAFMLKNG